jgi:hypothetical protein
MHTFIIEEDPEEKALGISEHNTVNWRQHNIPDSDGFEFELGQMRKRSDIVSTAHCDSHDQKYIFLYLACQFTGLPKQLESRSHGRHNSEPYPRVGVS